MTDMFDMALEALEGVLSQRAARSCLEAGLSVQGRTVDSANLEDYRAALRSNVFRQLQVVMPATAAAQLIREVEFQLEQLDNERLEATSKPVQGRAETGRLASAGTSIMDEGRATAIRDPELLALASSNLLTLNLRTLGSLSVEFGDVLFAERDLKLEVRSLRRMLDEGQDVDRARIEALRGTLKARREALLEEQQAQLVALDNQIYELSQRVVVPRELEARLESAKRLLASSTLATSDIRQMERLVESVLVPAEVVTQPEPQPVQAQPEVVAESVAEAVQAEPVADAPAAFEPEPAVVLEPEHVLAEEPVAEPAPSSFEPHAFEPAQFESAQPEPLQPEFVEAASVEAEGLAVEEPVEDALPDIPTPLDEPVAPVSFEPVAVVEALVVPVTEPVVLIEPSPAMTSSGFRFESREYQTTDFRPLETATVADTAPQAAPVTAEESVPFEPVTVAADEVETTEDLQPEAATLAVETLEPETPEPATLAPEIIPEPAPEVALESEPELEMSQPEMPQTEMPQLEMVVKTESNLGSFEPDEVEAAPDSFESDAHAAASVTADAVGTVEDAPHDEWADADEVAAPEAFVSETAEAEVEAQPEPVLALEPETEAEAKLGVVPMTGDFVDVPLDADTEQHLEVVDRTPSEMAVLVDAPDEDSAEVEATAEPDGLSAEGPLETSEPETVQYVPDDLEAVSHEAIEPETVTYQPVVDESATHEPVLEAASHEAQPEEEQPEEAETDEASIEVVPATDLESEFAAEPAPAFVRDFESTAEDDEARAELEAQLEEEDEEALEEEAEPVASLGAPTDETAEPASDETPETAAEEVLENITATEPVAELEPELVAALELAPVGMSEHEAETVSEHEAETMSESAAEPAAEHEALESDQAEEAAATLDEQPEAEPAPEVVSAPELQDTEPQDTEPQDTEPYDQPEREPFIQPPVQPLHDPWYSPGFQAASALASPTLDAHDHLNAQPFQTSFTPEREEIHVENEIMDMPAAPVAAAQPTGEEGLVWLASARRDASSRNADRLRKDPMALKPGRLESEHALAEAEAQVLEAKLHAACDGAGAQHRRLEAEFGLKVAQAAVELASKRVEAVSLRERYGAASKAELEHAQLELERAEEELKLARLSEGVAPNVNAGGEPMVNRIEVDAERLKIALQSTPEMLSARHALERAELELAIRDNPAYPASEIASVRNIVNQAREHFSTLENTLHAELEATLASLRYHGARLSERDGAWKAAENELHHAEEGVKQGFVASLTRDEAHLKALRADAERRRAAHKYLEAVHRLQCLTHQYMLG